MAVNTQSLELGGVVAGLIGALKRSSAAAMSPSEQALWSSHLEGLTYAQVAVALMQAALRYPEWAAAHLQLMSWASTVPELADQLVQWCPVSVVTDAD